MGVLENAFRFARPDDDRVVGAPRGKVLPVLGKVHSKHLIIDELLSASWYRVTWNF